MASNEYAVAAFTLLLGANKGIPIHQFKDTFVAFITMLRASAVRADEFRVLIRDSNVCFAARQTFGCKNHSPHQGKQRQKEQIDMIYSVDIYMNEQMISG